MKTFIANFGRANYLWPNCKDKETVATFDDEDLYPFWERGDREGYIAHAVANKKSAAGITPTKPVASRWFNLATIISETSDDLWVHREKEELWWTISKTGPAQITLEPSSEPERTGTSVYVIQKPTNQWSNKDKKGRRLEWRALHPRARDFLFTEGTLQKLSEDNALYAQALVDGDDLSGWHSLPIWQAKQEKSGKAPVTVYPATRKAAYRMAKTALSTTSSANGQEDVRTIKNKEFRFNSQIELEEYLEALLLAQENVCAITSLPLQFDGEETDAEMLCSLDRIDSNGHYEIGNLQIVCRFVNRWKSDSDNNEFLRLIHVIQDSEILTEMSSAAVVTPNKVLLTDKSSVASLLQNCRRARR